MLSALLRKQLLAAAAALPAEKCATPHQYTVRFAEKFYTNCRFLPFAENINAALFFLLFLQLMRFTVSSFLFALPFLFHFTLL